MQSINSFEPIIYENSNILILGSIPGIKSLEMKEYYAHPRNHFWKLLAALYNEDLPYNYKDKLEFLKSHNIALWDMIDSCKRNGSLDSKIQQETLNPVQQLINDFPNIKHIFLNGSKSFELFKKQIRQHPVDIHYTRLDSSSPAYTKSFELKLENWEQILEVQKKFR